MALFKSKIRRKIEVLIVETEHKIAYLYSQKIRFDGEVRSFIERDIIELKNLSTVLKELL